MNDDIPASHKSIMVILAIVGIFCVNFFLGPKIEAFVKGPLSDWFGQHVPETWKLPLSFVMAAVIVVGGIWSIVNERRARRRLRA